MIELIAQADVSPRMGLPDVAAASPTFSSAIRGAHLRVQSILDTRLDKGSSSDIFLLNKDLCGGKVMGGFFRLRLKRGMLRSTPAPVVVSGETIDYATDVAAEAVIGYKVDYNKGFVFVPESYEGRYVRVDYDYGFDKEDLPDVVPVPEELREALVSLAAGIILFSSGNREKPILLKDLDPGRQAVQHALDVLAPYLRTLGVSISPVF